MSSKVSPIIVRYFETMKQLEYDKYIGDFSVVLLPLFIINIRPHDRQKTLRSGNARFGRRSYLDSYVSTDSFYGFSRTETKDGPHRAPERFLMIRVGSAQPNAELQEDI